jgi:hypothetical protein
VRQNKKASPGKPCEPATPARALIRATIMHKEPTTWIDGQTGLILL